MGLTTFSQIVVIISKCLQHSEQAVILDTKKNKNKKKQDKVIKLIILWHWYDVRCKTEVDLQIAI